MRWRRSSSPRARPARRRACLRPGTRRRSHGRRECYAIGPDDRFVAAFAPFALYGPAIGVPSVVPDCDITSPRPSAPTRWPTRRRGRRDARLRIAAALDRGRHRGELTPEGAPRSVRSGSSCPPARRCRTRARGGRTARIRSRAAHAVRDDRGAVGHGHRPRDAGCSRPGAGGVRRPSARRRRGPDRAARGRRRRSGEIVVSAPWLSLGYDGLWATNDQARTWTQPASSGIAQAMSASSTTKGVSGSKAGWPMSSRPRRAR